jgi:FKBP-type peptidyl-prolyl cis-trans isomerase
MKISFPILITSFLISCSSNIFETKSGVKYKILEKGSGLKAQAGDEVFIFETTSYRNGTILYSNYNSTNPIKILLGGNQATLAVDEGISGMRVNEVRELIAPHYLVKRKTYPENVSPDSTLVIKIKLSKVVRK